MLVVKIEYWPGGNEKKAELLATQRIINDSSLAPTSDYIIETNDLPRDGVRVWRRTWVSGHKRSDGFWPLVHLAIASYNR